MHRLLRAPHAATVRALEEAQLGQHFNIVMDAPHISGDTACQLPHRHRSLSLQRMRQRPATLGELGEEACGSLEIQHPANRPSS